MRRFPIPTCLAATLLVLGACGGGDDDAADDGATAAGDEAAASDDASDGQTDVPASDQPETDEPAADEPAADGSGGSGGTATLTLANGDSFDFSILCMLESQTAAGSEILFTVVSYDDVGLDITQFGDEGTITGTANISVYDSSYDTIWDAGTLYEPFGGVFALSVDGSTVTGSGSFYPAGDITAEPVDGEVVANC